MLDDLAIRNATEEDLDLFGPDEDEEDCRDCMGRGYLDEYDPDRTMCLTCCGQGFISLTLAMHRDKITW
jgi:hypothetical protein